MYSQRSIFFSVVLGVLTRGSIFFSVVLGVLTRGSILVLICLSPGYALYFLKHASNTHPCGLLSHHPWCSRVSENIKLHPSHSLSGSHRADFYLLTHVITILLSLIRNKLCIIALNPLFVRKRLKR